MNYIKKVFSDKRVIKALVIIIISFIFLLIGLKLAPNKTWQFVVQVISIIGMFSQFPTIANICATYYAEEEAKEKEEKKASYNHKKKK